ncbi:MAG: hypothetical protein R3F56_05305 [Planctomycetota bacterium]
MSHRATTIGCILAILFGLAHLAGHVVFFGAEQATPQLAAGRAAMLAATVETAGMGTSRWALFLFFSLSLAIGSLAFGILGLATMRASLQAPAVARAVAFVGIGFALALLAAGAAHRVLQPIVAGCVLTVCFVAGLRPTRRI